MTRLKIVLKNQYQINLEFNSKNDEIKFDYIFKDSNHSEWLNVTHSQDNKVHFYILDHVRYLYTTIYEFEIITTFEGKNYTDTARLRLQK